MQTVIGRTWTTSGHLPESFHAKPLLMFHQHALPSLLVEFKGLGMRAYVYYIISGVLFLATVPMYRYMIDHAHSSDTIKQSLEPSSPAVLHAYTPVRHFVKTYYRYGEALPSGYHCGGADGVVYKTKSVDGSMVIEPLTLQGVLVRCGGDATSSHRF